MLNPGAVYAVCHGSANATLLAACQTTDGHMTYNGNDALELVCNGATMDVIGQIGNDPGATGWGTGNCTTTDHDLRRKCSVTQGRADGSTPFDPATEWDCFGPDAFDDLGLRVCVQPYQHTIAIDGVNDFAAPEIFQTTSGTFLGYISWDTAYLYVGMDGSDVGSGDPNRWVVVYLGGTTGTTTGVTYNTQTPALPFSAGYHVRWKTDNTYTNALAFDGTGWVDAAWDFTGNVMQQGTFMEMRIPLANIGSPTSIAVHLCMINETGGGEWTWAGVPTNSFVDGIDPDYGHYFQFDLTSSATPVSYTPLP